MPISTRWAGRSHLVCEKCYSVGDRQKDPGVDVQAHLAVYQLRTFVHLSNITALDADTSTLNVGK